MSWTVLEQIAKWVKSFACMRRTWIVQGVLTVIIKFYQMKLPAFILRSVLHQLLTGSGPGYHNLVHSDVGCTLDAEDCYVATSWNSDNSFPWDQLDVGQISTLEGWRLAVKAYYTGHIGLMEPIPGFWCPMFLNLVLYADDWSLVIRLHLICIVCKSWK